MAFSSETKLVVKTSVFSAIFTVVLLVLMNYLVNHTWTLGESSSSKNPPITVQGSGTISAKPDQSDVSFTVSKTASTLNDAQNQANTSMNKMVGDLQKMGIDKKDIQTNNYNSSPNYSDDQGTMQPQYIIKPRTPSNGIDSYTVSEDVTVSLHDVAKANNVIDTVTKDGAENVSGPDLSFSDTKQKDLENQARTAAIKDAKEKAQSMADAAGVHLGKLVKIEETNQAYPIVRPMMMDAAGSAKSTATQINPGQNTVTASVTLSYETW